MFRERGRFWVLLWSVLLIPLGSLSGAELDSPDQQAHLSLSTQSADTIGEPAESEVIEVPKPSPLAIQYYHTGNTLWLVSCALRLAIPILWLVSGAWSRWGEWAKKFGWLEKPVLVAGYFAGTWLLEFPFAYYAGFLRSHAYGLSRQGLPSWSSDQFKSLGFELILVIPVTLVVYVLLRWRPKTWYLVAAALCLPGTLALALIKPIWIDPAFNEFGRMKNQALEVRILELGERAGIKADRVYEVDMSQKTRAVNAYVTGLLGTKRIVLWDTLLERLDEDEVLSVMGHEMGHYVLNHVLLGVTMSCVLVGLGLFLVDRTSRMALNGLGGRWGLSQLSDLSSLPLLIAIGFIVNMILTPIGYTFSRSMEHEADRFTLELNQNNAVAARTFVALQRENLGYPRPNPWIHMLRSTHPSLGERIDFSNSYFPWKLGHPLRYGKTIKTPLPRIKPS